MTEEEFRNLTKEELYALPQEVFLKHLVRFTEERYISYKKLLEDEHKDKAVYEPGSWQLEFKIWFKEHLREMKNYEEGNLKDLRVELEYCRQGMNPPFCYPEYWREKDEKAKKVKIECTTCKGKGTILVKEDDISQTSLL